MDNTAAAVRLSEAQKERMQAREASYRYTLETEKRHERLFGPYQVSFSMYRTLAYLVLHDGEAAPSQIADDLLILRQSMTNIMDHLEERSLIERVGDPKDRRRLRVHLLPAGQELAAQLIQEEDRYGCRIREYLGDQQADQFHILERQMYEAKVAALNDILAERKE